MLSKTKNEISVTYDDNDSPITRSDFIWLLFSWKQVIKVRVASFLTFHFILPSHSNLQADYRYWRNRFLRGVPNDALRIEDLPVYNSTQARYRPNNQAPSSRRQGAAYTRYCELGRRSSSIVDRVCNVSSGRQYVRKKYTQVRDSHLFLEQIDTLMDLRHVSSMLIPDLRKLT